MSGHRSKVPRPVRENLHFLCAEIDGQLLLLEAFFREPATVTARRIIDRAGYAHNLKTRILDGCIRRIAAGEKPGAGKAGPGKTGTGGSGNAPLVLRSLELVATDLQRLAGLARQALHHVERIEIIGTLAADRYPQIVRRIRASVGRIEEVFLGGDSEQAIAIGRSRDRIEADYRKLFRHYTRQMRNPDVRPADVANALLVASEMERMGETLTSISEALISANIGQPVDFERYFALRSLMTDLDGPETALSVETIAETRSGSSISAILDRRTETVAAVYKDGDKNKVREERQAVKGWQSVYPGLAPRILSYEKRSRSAALLIEHLPGLTFERMVLSGDDALCDAGLARLTATLKDVWKQTRTDEPAELASMRQLAGRLGEVRRVHPEFRDRQVRFAGEDLACLDRLIEEAGRREAAVTAPFSVYIHGDFNLDNIIYDPAEDRVHFIDLHRSRFMDYVQDVSVFMVSNYRLQVLDRETRGRIARVSQAFYKSTRAFARKQGDDTFEFRLALGLARSFATSTRFILDKSHARRMWLRARYLIERALACPPGEEARFRLQMKELLVD